MKPICLLTTVAVCLAATSYIRADDNKDNGKRWKSAEKWEKESSKNYEKQRKRAIKDMEKRWKEDDRVYRDQFGNQRYFSRDNDRQFDDDFDDVFDDDSRPTRQYTYRVNPDRRVPPPLPVPRHEERYEEIDPGYESPRYHSSPRYDSRPRYYDERYVEPYVEPRYSGRSQHVGESIGARIGGLIGGSEGASIGASIGADIGAEVDRDRYRDGRW